MKNKKLNTKQIITYNNVLWKNNIITIIIIIKNNVI